MTGNHSLLFGTTQVYGKNIWDYITGNNYLRLGTTTGVSIMYLGLYDKKTLPTPGKTHVSG